MLPWLTTSLPRCELELFAEVQKLISRLPDEKPDPKMSCHVVARAVWTVLPNALDIEVVDGYFAQRFNHSWCVTKMGNIIDVYPVAQIGGPVLLDGSSHGPWRYLFNGLPRMVDRLWWETEVDTLTLQRTINLMKGKS